MICPACGYENFHPNATNCDLCHAVLKPDGAKPAAKEKEGDKETMRLVAEAIGEAPPEARSQTAVKPKKPRPAPQQKKGGGPDDEGIGGLDATLFALSLPVSFPVAAGGFFAGRNPSSIPGGPWAAGAAAITGGLLLAFQLMGAPRPVWIHVLLGVAFLANLCGSWLLIRRGDGNLGVPGLLASLGGVCVLLGAIAFAGGVGQLEGHTAMVLSLDVTPDGRRAISGSEDSTAIVWDLTRGQQVAQLTGHREGISSVRLSADGKLVVTGSWDGTLRVWGGEPMAEQRSIKSPRGGITCVALSSDGKMIALGTVGGEVEVHDPSANGARISRPRGHDKGVEALAFGTDGRLASAASDGTIYLWDPANGSLTQRLPGHPRSVRALAFSKDGKRLYAAGLEGGVKVWDLGGGTEEKALPGVGDSPIRALALRKDGRWLLGVDAERNLLAWDLSKGALAGKVALEAGRHPPSAVAWAGDRCLVTLDNTIRFVDPAELGVQ